MEDQNIKISIILPNFNGEKYLSQAINSFIEQDYNFKELIIVDGKSTDKSHDIIEKYNKDHSNIIWIKEHDTGISNAFNIGLEHVGGDIIGFLASDDLLFKGIFNEIVYNSNWCDFDGIYFDSYLYYKKTNKCILREVPSYEISKLNLLKFGTTVGFESMYFKKHIYDKYKLDEKNKYSMDYELYLRILSSEDNLLLLKINKVGVIAIFDDNISSTFGDAQREELIKVAQKYSEGLNVHRFFDIENKPTLLKRILNKLKSIV
ncbi:MAG: glycosyltransferase [Flavobacterium sp.]